MKKTTFLLLGALATSFLSSCAVKEQKLTGGFNEDGTFDQPMDTFVDVENDPDINFDKGALLVKYKEGATMLDEKQQQRLGIESINKIPGTNWNVAKLCEGKQSNSEIKKFRSSGYFELVDYDYIYGKGDDAPSGTDQSLDQSAIFNSIHLDEAYDYMEENGGERGGSSNVIVAVLDTGVDINHVDLRDNIWTNAGETDDNGTDDDSNGHIDDIHGWNFVADNADVSDDNGHGTHVAGIIASEKNDYGTTGIAYNCKIMPVKCGNSSGFFNNSWIAAAITYAASNGADVINMSFGGSGAMSLAVEEALKDAYTSSFLVAAAGNDSAQNESAYPSVSCIPIYPACYPYVFGVMSASTNAVESWFTNFDSVPNDKIEYNVYAPGEAYHSTFPGNRYASLNGTSMACPTVAGVAALIRSMHPEKDQYPTKFISSQIQNTSETSVTPSIVLRKEPHKYLNAFNALSKASKPNVRLYDFYTFDDETISSKNNGNRVIDSGETIQIGMELENIGGKSYQTKATIDTKRLADDITDPYITILKDNIDFDEIGVYSRKDTGLKYGEDGSTVVGTSQCFEIIFADNCPDNYMTTFNLHLEYQDEAGTKYTTEDSFNLSVTNRILLSGRIDKEVVLPANTSYILLSTLTITETGSLTIEEGVDIQMYNDTSTAYYGKIQNSPKIVNNGTLSINGVEGNMVKIHNSDLYKNYMSFAAFSSTGTKIKFLDAENFSLGSVEIWPELPVRISNSCISYKTDYYFGTIVNFSESSTNAIFKDTSNLFFQNSTIKLDWGGFNGANWLALSAEETLFYFANSGESNDGSYVEFELAGNSASFKTCLFVSKETNVNFWENERIAFDDCVFASLFKNPSCGFSFGRDGHNTGGSFKNCELVNINKDYFENSIHDKNAGVGNYEFTFENDGTKDLTNVPPYVTSLKLYDSNGVETRLVGREAFTVKIEFNTDMDVSLDLDVRFGSVEPYAEYKIKGSYVDKRHWEGTYTLNSRIEGGINRFRITNGRSDAHHSLELVDMGSIFKFNIDTAGSLAMSLQGIDQEDGIHLSWMQDDYETVMGYNIYRRDSADGQDIRINPTLIPQGENSYLDSDVEPGKTYWYSFTYVLTDLTEGKPSSLIQCTAKDTIAPTIRHTPVNQGYLNNNLVISCVARDNVSVQSAKLYFRTKGETEYASVPMVKNNDSYFGSINGSLLTLKGIEYYIEVSDGVNVTTKGTAAEPYSVTIKDSAVLSKKGDVNGDGIINSKDALMLEQHLAGGIVLTDDQFKRGDINGNGSIDAKEIMWILQYINGNINSFENLK